MPPINGEVKLPAGQGRACRHPVRHERRGVRPHGHEGFDRPRRFWYTKAGL